MNPRCGGRCGLPHVGKGCQRRQAPAARSNPPRDGWTRRSGKRAAEGLPPFPSAAALNPQQCGLGDVQQRQGRRRRLAISLRRPAYYLSTRFDSSCMHF